ncbi:MAG: ABC transporter ATP-binding protein [Phycisphaerae bacterium]|nr:ABC transporter ATP-binding protein [Phycisphaerae bacterium]
MSTPGDQPRSGSPLLEVDELKVWFQSRRVPWFGRSPHRIKAVDGVNLHISEGTTFALVGESGSGKSTLGRTVLRLIEPQAGTVRFEGESLFAMPTRRLRTLRGRMQMVFQDASGSLNPRVTIGGSIAEPLCVRRDPSVRPRRFRREAVATLLHDVGLPPEWMDRFPHELSGGQRQRVAIARALSTRPQFIVCDEPVSALDVSVRSQIINLLSELQHRYRLTYLLIAHDFALVRQAADEVAVMYAGRIVEQASAEQLFSHPGHPYTRLLLESFINPVGGDRRHAPDRPHPDAARPASTGCAFAARCPLCVSECLEVTPALIAHEGFADGHLVACHRAAESGASAATPKSGP